MGYIMIEGQEEVESVVLPREEAVAEQEESLLGKQLREIRNRFIAKGGKLLTREEIRREIAERRGGVYAREYEEEKRR